MLLLGEQVIDLTNPIQWGHARVNSFVTKSKGTWGGADKDLAAKLEAVNENLLEFTEEDNPRILERRDRC